MKHFLKNFGLLSLAVVGLWSCDPDEPNPEPGAVPMVKIEQVTPSADGVEIKFALENAERAVYKIIAADEQKPDAAALLADPKAEAIDLTAPTVKKTGLEPDKDYLALAVAVRGDTVSALAEQPFHTTVKTASYDFLHAIATYHGSDRGSMTAWYIIDFSTNAFSTDGSTDRWPVSHLYVSLTGSAEEVNLSKLTVPAGTYTLGDVNAMAAGKFYPGMFDGEAGAAYNTFLATQEVKDGPIGADLIVDGQITISETAEAGKYKIEAEFVYEDGTRLPVSYEGVLPVDNASGEVPPSDELPLPESPLAGDEQLTITEAYYTNYGDARYGDKGRTELYLQLYVDNVNYSSYLDLFLLIDPSEYPGDKVLPAGKYPVLPWYQTIVPELSAIAGYHVKTDTNPDVWLGCNYTFDYSSKVALTGGEVEVISCDADMNVELKFTLTDNAATPHTVSGTFKGRLQ